MLQEVDGWGSCCHGACASGWILCETLWYLQTTRGPISRLGSELAREWVNVTCSHLRRARSGYVRRNKDWVGYNVNKAVLATRTEHRERDMMLVKRGLPLMTEETWMAGALGLIQFTYLIQTLTFCPLLASLLFWLVLHKTIRAKCLDNSSTLFQNHKWPDL